MLGVDYDLIGRAIFWAWLGFSGSGGLWRPVRVHTELLGKVHVASFGSHLAGATLAGQTLVSIQIIGSL